ncbi:MAG: hypothetical protein LUG13_06595 [Oscillospiraceae bacterium]|nr:hypothetical protein [Oscillospiraceae bacterium]
MTTAKTTKIFFSIIVILAIALFCCILYGVNRTKVIDRIDGSCVYVIRSAAYSVQEDIDRMRDQTLALEKRQEALLKVTWNLEKIDHYVDLISNYEDIGSLGSIENKFENIGWWLLGGRRQAGYPAHDSTFTDGVIDEQEAVILELLYTDMKNITDSIPYGIKLYTNDIPATIQITRSEELIPLLNDIIVQWDIPAAGGTRWEIYEVFSHVT